MSKKEQHYLLKQQLPASPRSATGRAPRGHQAQCPQVQCVDQGAKPCLGTASLATGVSSDTGRPTPPLMTEPLEGGSCTGIFLPPRVF